MSGDSDCAKGDRHYPEHADLVLAAGERSRRYYFTVPIGGVISVRARDVEQARQLAADEHPGHGVDEFEEVGGFE